MNKSGKTSLWSRFLIYSVFRTVYSLFVTQKFKRDPLFPCRGGSHYLLIPLNFVVSALFIVLLFFSVCCMKRTAFDVHHTT